MFVFITISIIKFCGGSRRKGEDDRDCTRLFGLAKTFVWEDARVWGDEDAGMIVPERIP